MTQVNMVAQKYKHIIWDWNGTLFDDRWLCLETINHLLQERQLPVLSPERYETIFGFPVIEYYKQAGFDFTDEPFEVVSTAFIEGYEARRSQCQLREGTVPVLSRIRQMGLSQSILWASKQSLLNLVVDHHDLSHFFIKVMGIDNHHAAGKLAIGQVWIDEINIPPNEILLIGDTTHDYEVAQALGIDCWLMPSGHQSRVRLAACGTKVIDSLAAVLD